MREKLKRFITNPYVIISIVYLLAHFFLLILNGCWWDDWTFSTHNIDYIHNVASESGRPEWNFLIPFCWSLPNNGRILIFFIFYCITIFVYEFLRKSDLFDEHESLLITLFFSIIPVNDARLLISNFSYTTGLFFFYLGLMLFVRWNKMESGRKKYVFRILLLLCFYIGFILNSVLAYYYILIAYLFVLDIRQNDEPDLFKKTVSSVINVLKKYPDFFVLPFVYYIVNKTFFPTYGPNFGGYNEVTVNKLLKCVVYLPLSALNCIYLVIFSWLKNLSEWWIMAVFFVFALIVFLLIYRKKKENGEKDYSWQRLLLYLVYGSFLMFMSLLPYVVVREEIIETTGIQGRDAMLTPLGSAIIIFALGCLINKRYRKYIFILLITLGIIQFNMLYLEWQKDYYYQLSMEDKLDTRIIRNNDTFFLADLNETKLGGQRYYGLNTNGMNVFGDQSRLFLPKVYDLYILNDRSTVDQIIKKLSYSTMMKDYKPADLNLDAVIIYSCDLSTMDTIRLKLLNMLGSDSFDKYIRNNGELRVVEVDDDFTRLLMKEIENGEVSNDEGLLLLLFDYLGEVNYAK